MFDGQSTTADDSGAIQILGAREHNLKNISVTIPRGQFVVVTGVSGSGKSTVATVTEVYHFLRLLFARLGTQHCPDCGVPVEARTRDELGRHLQQEAKSRGVLKLLAPVVRNRKGFHSEVADWAAKHGYEELRADGKLYRTDGTFRLERFKEHDVEVVVGTLGRETGDGACSTSLREMSARRRAGGSAPCHSHQQLIDEALHLGKGTIFALDAAGTLTIHSTERACPKCSRSFAPLDPKHFSYNSSQGWCPQCRGFGELFHLPDVERGANADAVEESWWSWAQERELCPSCQGARLRPESRAVRLHLPGMKFPGVGDSPTIDDFSSLAVAHVAGMFSRFRPKGRFSEIARDIIPEIRERLRFLDEVGLGYLQLGRSVTTLSGGEAQRIRLAAQLGSNLSGVLYVLDEPTIGLHPRDNEQLLSSLARLRARGNSLVVVEHDEDTMRHADWIIDLGPGAGVKGGEIVASGTLKELLKHKESITGRCLRAMETKRYPTRGERRTVSEITHKPVSGRSKPSGLPTHWLTLRNALINNLKNLSVRFPLNRFIVVTGVSGSGKSTLVRECLLPALQEAMKRREGKAGRARSRQDSSLTGHEVISAVHEVDQSPIGRTPRSTPATYVGFFDDIRQLFAQVPEARMRGYGPGRFSFNSAQGRCATCEGAGTVKLEMNFLPPAFVKCETCQGRRFTPETLDVQFSGRDIAQVLDMSVVEAMEFFSAQKRIHRPLEALHDTGLDYLRLGQTSPTLSGGEAQRIKLVTHLLSGLKPAPDTLAPAASRVAKSKFFILEEPTIGLHMSDVHRLIEVIQRLVDAGHTVLVIEHNLDLIAEADWVIDLGPEGGAAGGEIVAEGTPEQLVRNKRSHTGRFLKKLLKL